MKKKRTIMMLFKMYRQMLLCFIMIQIIAAQTQIAYSVDKIECKSSTSMTDTEACDHWRKAMKFRKMEYVVCKEIILADSKENGLVCTPTIVDYDGTMVYVDFFKEHEGISANVNYTGLSLKQKFIFDLVLLLLLFICLGTACTCENDHYPQNSRFVHGALCGALMSRAARSRSRSNRTGGWGVAR